MKISVRAELLRRRECQERFPDLFEYDGNQLYFRELPAHGNASWLDFTPDLVLVVTNEAGDPVLALNASDWYMTESGFELPEEDE